MAQLIEAAAKVKGILTELKKGSSPLPTVAADKDATAKGKDKRKVFNTARNRKEVLNIQTLTSKVPTPS